MALNGFVPHGFAFGGKIYSTGVTPIDGGKYGSISSDVGFSKITYDKVSYGGLKPVPVIPNSIFDLVVPGIYSMNLSTLKDMDGFSGFMTGCFSHIDYDVPVLMFVSSDNFNALANNEVSRYLLLLHYSQFHEEKGDSYDRDRLYKALSGNLVPEISKADMQHLSYTIDNRDTNIGDITTSVMSDVINNGSLIQVKYDNELVNFYTTSYTDYVQLYVGGYGFKAYYPQNYIFLSFKLHPYNYISVRSYEQIHRVSNSSSISDYQRNYKFTTDTNNNTLAWNDLNPYDPTANNSVIPYTYEHQSNVLVSLDVPYNPSIYTIIGEKPFEEKIQVSSYFYTLDNIGICHTADEVSDTTWASNIKNTLSSSSCLPLGEYVLPYKNSISNAPVSNGTYSLNAFSAGNGSLVQQVLADPGVAQYNKYTRSWSTNNSKYGGWSGSNII